MKNKNNYSDGAKWKTSLKLKFKNKFLFFKYHEL